MPNGDWDSTFPWSPWPRSYTVTARYNSNPASSDFPVGLTTGTGDDTQMIGWYEHPSGRVALPVRLATPQRARARSGRARRTATIVPVNDGSARQWFMIGRNSTGGLSRVEFNVDCSAAQTEQHDAEAAVVLDVDAAGETDFWFSTRSFQQGEASAVAIQAPGVSTACVPRWKIQNDTSGVENDRIIPIDVSVR